MAVAPTIGGLLGERVRELRKKRGLTQVEFAALCGVPQSRISTIENGSRVPNVETVIRLARALDCRVTALMSVFDKSDLSSFLPK
jgi:transcriptional regulator with XRE-family HTH domain